MDVLSEVLNAVKLEGALFFHGEFSAPWCFSSSGPSGLEPFLKPPVRHIVIFHFLIEGRAYAALKNGERVELTAGDIVIFPHGDTHFVGNGPAVKPVDSFKTFSKHLADGLKVMHYGGGGELTRFVCGYMACDPHLCDTILAGLPRMFRVPVADEPSGRWIENSIRFSVAEASDHDAGSSLVVEKLSEVLFIETLRRYINSLPPDRTGWLAGARDQVIGKTLALMHQDPSHPWTVDDLARRVGLSRTRLAERFRHFLGMSPIAYLTEWRLKLGAEKLRSTRSSVAEVAFDVGYNSEAAFSRAFRRVFDTPPAQFRQQKRSAGPRVER
jgi:AraC-like DNA-binding protein